MAIALSAGVVLGAAFVATRRLWLAVGLHFGVNLSQGALLGLPVSGHPTPGLMTTQLSGPALLAGGDFGLEASVLIPLLSLALGAALLRHAVRTDRLRRAPWSRARPE